MTPPNLFEAQLSITRPPAGGTTTRTVRSADIVEHLLDSATRIELNLDRTAEPEAQREHMEMLRNAAEVIGRAHPSALTDESDLIDEDPPQDHSTIAAMSHATSLALVECREAVARRVDAEQALEVERRNAARLRELLSDAAHALDSASKMTSEPDVARYLTIAADQTGVSRG